MRKMIKVKIVIMLINDKIKDDSKIKDNERNNKKMIKIK